MKCCANHCQAMNGVGWLHKLDLGWTLQFETGTRFVAAPLLTDLAFSAAIQLSNSFDHRRLNRLTVTPAQGEATACLGSVLPSVAPGRGTNEAPPLVHDLGSISVHGPGSSTCKVRVWLKNLMKVDGWFHPCRELWSSKEGGV